MMTTKNKGTSIMIQRLPVIMEIILSLEIKNIALSHHLLTLNNEAMRSLRHLTDSDYYCPYH